MHRTQQVDPRSLVFSPWNVNSVPEENQRKLEESIRRNGIYRPVIVRELEDGSLQVIAGEHTTRAAIALGYETIDVYNLGRIDEVRAKEISVIDNQHYGHEDSFGLANLLREFEGDVATFMPFDDEDLKAIFKATSIDFDSLELPETAAEVEAPAANPEDDLASAPITHQLMRMKVPIGDADFVTRCLESVMKRQGFTGGDSLTNAGDALVYILRNWSSD